MFAAAPLHDALQRSDVLLLVAHLFATSAMVGLIWFVQMVHYPLFGAVGTDRFAEYSHANQRRTSFVVGPFMAVEGVTALWLALRPPPGVDRVWTLVGLGLLAVVLASTVLFQVPHHASFLSGFDGQRVRRLVRSNWIRTIGWSARGLLAAALLVTAVN